MIYNIIYNILIDFNKWSEWRYKKYIREFLNNVLKYNSNVLFCIHCNKKFLDKNLWNEKMNSIVVY